MVVVFTTISASTSACMLVPQFMGCYYIDTCACRVIFIHREILYTVAVAYRTDPIDFIIFPDYFRRRGGNETSACIVIQSVGFTEYCCRVLF